MKVKMTRTELINFLNGLPIVGNLEGFKLAYAVAKNKRALEAERKLLQEANKPSAKYQEYEIKRIQLCQKLAEKDDTGQPKIKNGSFVGVKGNPEFEKGMKELDEEFKEALEKNKKMNEENAKMLSEEIEFEMYMVKSDQLPKNITVQQLDILMPMVEHTEH